MYHTGGGPRTGIRRAGEKKPDWEQLVPGPAQQKHAQPTKNACNAQHVASKP